jgi:hypothetical protein
VLPAYSQYLQVNDFRRSALILNQPSQGFLKIIRCGSQQDAGDRSNVWGTNRWTLEDTLYALHN